MSTDARRTAFILGLRELAHFLTENPDVPISDIPRLTYHPDGDDVQSRAEVDRVAGLLGVEPTGAASAHYRAVRMFGPIEFGATAILRDEMDRWQALMSYSKSVQPEDGGRS